MFILGIDYGRRFIGLAVSDYSGNAHATITPLPALVIKGFEPALSELLRIVTAYRIDTLVFGLPKPGPKDSSRLVSEIYNFAQKLSALAGTSQPNFVDESLTSFEAGRRLKGVLRKKKREAENSLAAVLILEDFINRLK